MKKMLFVPALLAWSATANAQGYDPSYSNMLNQNQRDLAAGQACFVEHDPGACASNVYRVRSEFVPKAACRTAMSYTLLT